MSSWNYENIDGKTFLQSDGAFVNAASGLLLIPSIPFAAAPFIQNNINEINAINNVQKQEENKIDNIIKEYEQKNNL